MDFSVIINIKIVGEDRVVSGDAVGCPEARTDSSFYSERPEWCSLHRTLFFAGFPSFSFFCFCLSKAETRARPQIGAEAPPAPKHKKLLLRPKVENDTSGSDQPEKYFLTTTLTRILLGLKAPALHQPSVTKPEFGTG
jgi:hypothetical protein